MGSESAPRRISLLDPPRRSKVFMLLKGGVEVAVGGVRIRRELPHGHAAACSARFAPSVSAGCSASRVASWSRRDAPAFRCDHNCLTDAFRCPFRSSLLPTATAPCPRATMLDLLAKAAGATRVTRRDRTITQPRWSARRPGVGSSLTLGAGESSSMTGRSTRRSVRSLDRERGESAGGTSLLDDRDPGDVPPAVHLDQQTVRRSLPAARRSCAATTSARPHRPPARGCGSRCRQTKPAGDRADRRRAPRRRRPAGAHARSVIRGSPCRAPCRA